MHRFFVDPAQIDGRQVRFAPAQAHQLGRVLRQQPGDQVAVLDNTGWLYTVTLTAVSPKRATGTITERVQDSGEPQVKLTLYQALLKRDKFEWVLQKGTEVGVSHFVPLVTQRSLVQTTAVKPNKQSRWQAILTEAAEQSRRSRIPTLADPLTLAAALPTFAQHDLVLLAWEDEQTVDVRTAVATRPTAQDVALLIGPEGGWSPEEVEACQAAGAQAITLGPRTLRTETAAVVGAALLLHELGAL